MAWTTSGSVQKYPIDRRALPSSGRETQHAVYRADSSAIYDVEVRELVATPGRIAGLKLNGNALLEVCSGRGLAIVSGQARELHRGSTLEVDNGALFTLAATGGAPVVLRAHVVRAR